MIRYPDSIEIVEVAPRDGLQSFSLRLDTARKIALVDRPSDAGFPLIEIASFAHSRFVPSLDDAEEVIMGMRRRRACRYRALVPDRRGAERAIACGGLDELLELVTISSAHSRQNRNMTVDEAITQGLACHRLADAAGLFFTMAVGMAICVRSKG